MNLLLICSGFYKPSESSSQDRNIVWAKYVPRVSRHPAVNTQAAEAGTQ